jgi:hypothetical protein
LRRIESREGVGAHRKQEGPTGCAFGRMFRLDGGISPTLFPSRLGIELTLIFSMMFGAERQLSSLHSYNFIYSSRQRGLGVGLLGLLQHIFPLEFEFH